MPTSACPFRSSKRMVENARHAHDAGVRPRSGRRHARRRRAPISPSSRAASQRTTRRSTRRPGLSRRSPSPLQEELTRDFQTTLLVLLGTAGFVLLIVCASIANLTLARMVRRQREMSVRAALGASRAAAAAAAADGEHAARASSAARSAWCSPSGVARPAGPLRRAVHHARDRNRHRPDGAALHAGRLGRRPGWSLDRFRRLPAGSARRRRSATAHGRRRRRTGFAARSSSCRSPSRSCC